MSASQQTDVQGVSMIPHKQSTKLITPNTSHISHRPFLRIPLILAKPCDLLWLTHPCWLSLSKSPAIKFSYTFLFEKEKVLLQELRFLVVPLKRTKTANSHNPCLFSLEDNIPPEDQPKTKSPSVQTGCVLYLKNIQNHPQ